MMATHGTMCPAIAAITILVFKVKAVIRSVLQLTLNDLLVGTWGNLIFCKGLWFNSIFCARNVTKTTKNSFTNCEWINECDVFIACVQQTPPPLFLRGGGVCTPSTIGEKDQNDRNAIERFTSSVESKKKKKLTKKHNGIIKTLVRLYSHSTF